MNLSNMILLPMHFTVVPIWAQTDILYLQAMGKLLLALVLKEYKTL